MAEKHDINNELCLHRTKYRRKFYNKIALP